MPVPTSWSKRIVPAYGPPLIGALGTGLLGVMVVDPHTTATRALVVLAMHAGIGAVAALLVGAPVTSRSVGRVELRLRVLVLGVVGTTLLARAAAVTDVRPGSFELHGAVLIWLWLTALLGVVALDTWRVRPPDERSEGTNCSNPLAAVHSTRVLPPLCALVKRTLDVGVALVALLVTLPVIVLAALAIKVDSKGGWLHVQTRLGVHGRPFRLLKLRTMRHGNDDSAHRAHMSALITGSSVPGEIYGKVARDPRLTRVGKILRRLSIDELPQLWNVIRGDMSLVGPRPPLPWEAQLYSDRMWGRLSGKPGITGLWQVEGRAKLPFREMVELDLRYWESWSPLQELKILARTPKAVLWSRNTE